MIWNPAAESMPREAREQLQLVAADHPEIAALRRRAAEQLRQATGLSVELTIVAPRTIPRSEGKAVRVIERG